MREQIRTFIRQYSQWFMPIILFIVAVSVILALFLDHTARDSHNRAQAEIVADALLLQRSAEVRLAEDQAIARMMQRALTGADAALFAGADGMSGEQNRVAQVLADAQASDSGIYLTLAVRQADGSGYAAGKAQAGAAAAAELPWFAEIAGLENGEMKIFHVGDDGLTGTDAVVCAGGFSLADGGTGVCLCFDDTWPSILSVTSRGKALMTIVDQNGTILMRSAVSDYFIRGEDYWKLIGGDAETSAKNHIRKKDSYAVYLASNNYTVIEVPMQADVPWAVCVSVSGIYIDRVADSYFESTKKLIIELLAAVVAFFALLIILNVIAKAKRLKESAALGEKADHDQLTGLRNKAATERDIQEFMDANPTVQSILFILDIDDFKGVNDTMGHSFGDDVLHEFGFRLGSMFRASDIAGRIGGDEFMVFVKNIPNEDTIEKEAKKIRDFIKSFRAGDGVKREVTASSGAAVFPADGADFETLYKSADKALYESKRSGKRQLSFFRH